MLSDFRDQVSDGFRRYAANTIWLLAERVFRTLVNFFVAVWVARYLGPTGFGTLSFAQSFVFLFSALSSLGLDSIVVRDLVRRADQKYRILGSAFALKLAGALLTFPVLAVAILFTDTDTSTRLLVFVVAASVIFQSLNVLDFYFQSQVLSRYVAIATSLMASVSAIVKIALILLDAPLIAFAIMMGVDAMVLAAGLLYFYLKAGQELRAWKFDPTIARSLLVESLPLILSGLVVSIYLRIDQVMINQMIGAAAVGQYAVAVRISEAYYLIPLAITSSLFPAIVAAREANRETYHHRLQGLYDVLVWSALAATAVILIFGDGLISLLFGPAYTDASVVLRIHILAAVFVSVGLVSNKYFAAENRQIHVLYRSLIGVVINVVLNLLWIPRYGVAGAAMAIVATQFATTYLYTAISGDVRVLVVMSMRSFYLPRVLRDLGGHLR